MLRKTYGEKAAGLKKNRKIKTERDENLREMLRWRKQNWVKKILHAFEVHSNISNSQE